MISTVTTAVTSVTTTVLTGSLALFITLMLLSLLIQKELISVSQKEYWQRVSRALNVVIVPLFLTFLAITAMKVIEVL